MSQKEKIVVGHVKVKRRYFDQSFKKVVGEDVQSILTDKHPEASEIKVQFHTNGLPKILIRGIDYAFVMRGTYPILLDQTQRA